MSPRIPPEITVNLTRTVVTAKLPVEFDRGTWFVELHSGYLSLRRARTTQTFTVDYESLISRAIAVDVESRRRAGRRR